MEGRFQIEHVVFLGLEKPLGMASSAFLVYARGGVVVAAPAAFLRQVRVFGMGELDRLVYIHEFLEKHRLRAFLRLRRGRQRQIRRAGAGALTAPRLRCGIGVSLRECRKEDHTDRQGCCGDSAHLLGS
jgi:hypothetical protein